MSEVVSIRADGSRRVQTIIEGPSLTRQEFRDECDLGMIIRRFSKTAEGRLALANAQGFASGRFEDVSAVPDLQTARNLINRGTEVFMALPAVLRRRFDNDASKYLDFVVDPANKDEMVSMGLLRPDVPIPVKAGDPAVPPAG